jgi:hypothetical protein
MLYIILPVNRVFTIHHLLLLQRQLLTMILRRSPAPTREGWPATRRHRALQLVRPTRAALEPAAPGPATRAVLQVRLFTPGTFSSSSHWHASPRVLGESLSTHSRSAFPLAAHGARAGHARAAGPKRARRGGVGVRRRGLRGAAALPLARAHHPQPAAARASFQPPPAPRGGR